MAVSLQEARGALWDALGALADACMTVRRLVDAEETRAVPAGLEVYMPLALQRAIERRDELYGNFLQVYAAEPQQGAAATVCRRPAAIEAPRIAPQDGPPARERSRSPRMGPVGALAVPHLPETTAGLRRRIADLQGDPELGCPSCELEALQRLLRYREGEGAGAGSGSSSSRHRSREEF